MFHAAVSESPHVPVLPVNAEVSTHAPPAGSAVALSVR